MRPTMGRHLAAAVAAAVAGTAAAQDMIVPVVTAVGTFNAPALGEYTTYQVACGFEPRTAADVYALFGDDRNKMTIPPAYQVPTPFGSNVGERAPPARLAPRRLELTVR